MGIVRTFIKNIRDSNAYRDISNLGVVMYARYGDVGGLVAVGNHVHFAVQTLLTA